MPAKHRDPRRASLVYDVHRAARIAAVAHGGPGRAFVARGRLVPGLAASRVLRFWDLGLAPAEGPGPSRRRSFNSRPMACQPTSLPCARWTTRRWSTTCLFTPAAFIGRERELRELRPSSSPAAWSRSPVRAARARPGWPCRWRPNSSTARATASGSSELAAVSDADAGAAGHRRGARYGEQPGRPSSTASSMPWPSSTSSSSWTTASI